MHNDWNDSCIGCLQKPINFIGSNTKQAKNVIASQLQTCSVRGHTDHGIENRAKRLSFLKGFLSSAVESSENVENRFSCPLQKMLKVVHVHEVAQASKVAKKLPRLQSYRDYFLLAVECGERPPDHVLYVNLPFCAFLGTNDVYLSQHSVNPTSTHIFYV